MVFNKIHFTFLFIFTNFILSIKDNSVGLERKDLYKKRIVENYHAPVWIPDSKADRCMNCSEEFNLIFRRKHHCREIGRAHV